MLDPTPHEFKWDPKGLPPRTVPERCANHHGMCAYRDDDPDRCQWCHRRWSSSSFGCRDEEQHAPRPVWVPS